MKISRLILSKLKSHLENKEISLVVGPRQSGKTTVLKALKHELDGVGRRTLYLSLDNESDRPFFDSQQSLISRMKLEFGNSNGVVFVDEIQRKPDAGIFLKGIYDQELPYKLVVSGSGSLELKEKIHESLAGRKRVFEMTTVNFWEFIDYRTDYKYTDRLPDFFAIDTHRASALLEEFLKFGGYPRVITADTLEEKRLLLDEIYSSYLEKDITAFLKVESLDAYRLMFKALAAQVGQLVKYAELSTTLSIAFQTVKNYFWYAQKTFMIQQVLPFHGSIRKEITKASCVYFGDLGLRNFCLGRLGHETDPVDAGLAFQNFVYQLLLPCVQGTGWDIHFWRTTDNAEVDFVLNNGSEPVPIEVKFKSLDRPRVPASLHSFISTYAPKKAYIVNKDLETILTKDNTSIHVLPYWKLSGRFWEE